MEAHLGPTKVEKPHFLGWRATARCFNQGSRNRSACPGELDVKSGSSRTRSSRSSHDRSAQKQRKSRRDPGWKLHTKHATR